ncbi:type III secretion system export apparatus subunit SctS [Plastoroseomonas hellenica]|uniref:EscS/YscS/HrcS family type III secretion system export apparatus protein n=1 Tax=Plastoroseomonas hellenica TaxID=2687306 RepID=A0ABS5ERI4_9PROT|nr:type III secretion system export apparatus subunit SctS [Plastoroseomonas hellenica]MBR0647778.1 EscS/YscS/HrcS family type III secretion system export apparatus protein [Plastoroseomonas hellenica]MBR0662909.1 EscS/YscS/HrcS family type III secretion system export apparatus protein [Plastoroseomonas hellenica]
MDHGAFVSHLQQTLTLVLWLSLPVLGVAAAVGLVVGLLQAVTQIQDQSLPQTAKLIAVLLTIVIAGPLLAGPLLRQAERVMTDFPTLSR